MKQMLHGETTMALCSSKNNNVRPKRTLLGQNERQRSLSNSTKNRIYTAKKHDTTNLCLFVGYGGVLQREHAAFSLFFWHFSCTLHVHMYTIVPGM